VLDGVHVACSHTTIVANVFMVQPSIRCLRREPSAIQGLSTAVQQATHQDPVNMQSVPAGHEQLLVDFDVDDFLQSLETPLFVKRDHQTAMISDETVFGTFETYCFLAIDCKLCGQRLLIYVQMNILIFNS
jgi:hypothetical protein